MGEILHSHLHLIKLIKSKLNAEAVGNYLYINIKVTWMIVILSK